MYEVKIWQVDFYRRPLRDEMGNPLWELVICDPQLTFSKSAFCPQSTANSTWIAEQMRQWGDSGLPDRLQVFRPQASSLVQAAGQGLEIPVEPTRHTPALKQLLREKAATYPTLPNFTGQPYEPVELEQPPPLPLPENLWGEKWRFATIASADLVPIFQKRPIPILEMPDTLLPVKLQIPSTTPIPGVVIDGGRQSMPLARWLQRNHPYALTYIPGDPDGLILEAGLVERWVLTTFTDQEMAMAAKTFRDRQQVTKGLHFLLIQPDDSGMTYTGFWLLKHDRGD